MPDLSIFMANQTILLLLFQKLDHVEVCPQKKFNALTVVPARLQLIGVNESSFTYGEQKLMASKQLDISSDFKVEMELSVTKIHCFFH